ncbi:MAG TPA: hypothetical protein VH253_01850 [Phycisphaerae bacterium]|nr:hypothetical protein [Phycisphaerae bacterium]
MDRRKAYLFYEAGQAVAAAHLGLTIRHVSGNPVAAATEISLPRNQPKARMILWLTGMAAEKRGAGVADPLRRTRTRQRIRAAIESIAAGMKGSPHQRLEAAKGLVNQAQDRANAICSNLYDAIEEVVERLRAQDLIPGTQVAEIVQRAKKRRTQSDGPSDQPGETAADRDG